MGAFTDFINLFAPPSGVAAENARQRAIMEQRAQQETFKQLEGLIGGPKPFEQDLFPGETPIPGLQTVAPGGTPEDFARTLIQSQSPGLAQQGVKFVQQILQGRQQRDIAAEGRRELERLEERRRQRFGQILPNATPRQQTAIEAVAQFGEKGLPFLKEQLTPQQQFTLAPGQTRFSAQGEIIASSKKQPELTTLQKNVAAAGFEVGTPAFNQAMQRKMFNIGAPDKTKEKQLRDSRNKFGQVEKSINSYEKLLTQFGSEVLPGADKTKLETTYFDLLLELKELYNLGVLNGPDLEIMESVIVNPTSVKGKLIESTGGRGALLDQVSLIKEKLNDSRSRAERLFGGKQRQDVSQMSDDELRAIISGQ